jgi:hypothetical protein
MAACGPGAACGLEVQRSPLSPPVVGGALVPSLSSSDAAVVLALTAALITSAAEVAGDSTTGVSSILLPNASWPEAFFSLSDVIGGTLLIKSYLGKQQIESGNAELSCRQDY